MIDFAGKITVALAGNPNCGKTTIFNRITGARQHVGNYPGVTVEKKEGFKKVGSTEVTVVDLPGTYSLTAFSPEEVVARNFIVREAPDVVVNIIDAANLERNLYLTIQLMELERPMVLALNMIDMVEESGVQVDHQVLSTVLGIPVVRTVGSSGQGIADLLNTIAATNIQPPHLVLSYHKTIETAVSSLIGQMQAMSQLAFPLRWIALRLLENDSEIIKEIQGLPGGRGIVDAAQSYRNKIIAELDQEPEWLIAQIRYEYIQEIYRRIISGDVERLKFSNKIDAVLTHRWLGLPIFFLLMWLVFYLVFKIGSFPQGWIEEGFGRFSEYISSLMTEGDLKSLIVDGVIGGVGSVLSFLPNILLLFLAISLLEDTGYMARAAFVMDKVMNRVGLHGKSFIPLLLGFGCTVPAILGTRTLENQRDRLITILVTPFMSCSARLPVYMVLTAAFFSEAAAGTVLFAIYSLGIVLAIVMARFFRSVLFSGSTEPFVMELPPYHVPVFKNILLTMWERSMLYIKKAGTIILAVTLLVWFATNYPRDIEFTKNYDEMMAAAQTQYDINIREQVLKPLHIQNINDNHMLRDLAVRLAQSRGEQQTTDVLAELTGNKIAYSPDVVAARHYMNILQQYEETKAKLDKQRAKEQLTKSFAGKLGKFIEPLIAPLGFDWKIGVGLIAGISAKEILVSTLATIYSMGAGQEGSFYLKEALVADPNMNMLVALSLMVFVLVYAPCLATIVVIKRETKSWKWAAFSFGYSTGLAWILSFIIFQGGKLFGLV